MKKYFTWRCIGLHVVTLLLVPAFLVAGWWQYHVALGGNDLSWVYTVEWPFFAVYALYLWWKLIHDERTPFDRLWVARQRAAADDAGTPLHQIPGWATDKALSRAVVAASVEAARLPALSDPQPDALVAPGPTATDATTAAPELDGVGRPDRSPATAGPCRAGSEGEDGDASVIDARVVEVKVAVDEELDAYNRYLAELSWRDPPKRWRPSRGRRRGAPVEGERPGPAEAVPAARQRSRPALPPGGGGPAGAAAPGAERGTR